MKVNSCQHRVPCRQLCRFLGLEYLCIADAHLITGSSIEHILMLFHVLFKKSIGIKVLTADVALH